MKYKWFSVLVKLPPVKKNFSILSENVLVKLDTGVYIEAYYSHSKRIWYNEENNKPLKYKVVEWCEVTV